MLIDTPMGTVVQQHSFGYEIKGTCNPGPARTCTILQVHQKGSIIEVKSRTFGSEEEADRWGHNLSHVLNVAIPRPHFPPAGHRGCMP